jgi:hypothetical protein
MTDLDEKSYDKLVRLPTFDGTHDQFQIFWMRYKVYAKVYSICSEDWWQRWFFSHWCKVTVMHITTAIRVRQDAAKKRDEIAIVNFTMAVWSTRRQLQISRMAWCTTCLLWQCCKDTCPQDTVTQVEVRRLITNDNMTDGELSYLTPNNICAGQSWDQIHFCRQLYCSLLTDSFRSLSGIRNLN